MEQSYFLFPVFGFILFIVLRLFHTNVDASVIPWDINETLLMSFYFLISTVTTTFVIYKYNFILTEFICTILNIPYELKKESVSVFTGDPNF